MTREGKSSMGLARFVIGLLAVVAVWAIYADLVSRYLTAWPERGLFGDMFGGLNALFTALAFGALIYTVLLQREELALQRQELADTREELAGQRKQLEKQSTHFERQNFEAQLLTLVNLHHGIVQSCEMHDPYGGGLKRARAYFEFLYVGRALITDLWRPVRAEVHRAGQNLPEDPRDAQSWKIAFEKLGADKVLSLVQAAYLTFYDGYRKDLSLYFRNLYRAFHIIDQASLLERTKRNYAGILRAQLSDFELAFLFINGITHYGAAFKPLIEHYALLNNAPDDLLLFGQGRVWYKQTAFEQSPVLFDDESFIEGGPPEGMEFKAKW